MSKKQVEVKNVGSEIVRSKGRIDNTGEVFTPPDLVNQMLAQIPLEKLQNSNSKFLDLCAGSGNFCIRLKELLCQFHEEQHVLDNMLYAVEFMEDNHRELCERLGVSTSHPHYVRADALTYHYKFDGTPSEVTLDQFFQCHMDPL
jgi:ubiquinone/menaquinone biosynthesis C-methylase UbiE